MANIENAVSTATALRFVEIFAIALTFFPLQIKKDIVTAKHRHYILLGEREIYERK